MLGQGVKKRRRQRAAPGHVVEQIALLEPPHHNDIIDDRVIGPPFSPPSQAADFGAADRPHFEIERRRGSAVELEFRGAGGEPKRKRRKIEIGVFDRSLQLVGIRPGNEHQRSVRLDDLHRRSGGQIRFGVTQERHDLLLFVIHPAPRGDIRSRAAPPARRSACRNHSRNVLTGPLPRDEPPTDAICVTAKPMLCRKPRMPPR